MNDTIAAIATPPGEGAIALLRLSGEESITITEKLFQGTIKPSCMISRHAYFGKIVHRGELLDEVLITLFRAPRSYTGEDIVEISAHGGSLIAARLLQSLLEAGARMARPGEFTQRAYLNGKMDLTQAEAVMDLIHAHTKRSQQAALDQLTGHLGEEISQLQKELLAAVAHLEAFFDFPEDDIAPETGAALRARIEAAHMRITNLLATAHEGKLLREGISLALCGAPNAGKSSLLNRLLRKERAIVSPIPGTTRDTIEEEATLVGFPFRLIDTAGVRSTEDPIEQEGVLRAQRSAEAADLCLHLVDATTISESITPILEGELLVFNKIDLLQDRTLLQKTYPTASLISCNSGEGIEELLQDITKKILPQQTHISEGISLLAINARHQACLERALSATEKSLSLIDSSEPLELLAIELRTALDAAGEVTGAIGTEEILGEIFGSFCIGK